MRVKKSANVSPRHLSWHLRRTCLRRCTHSQFLPPGKSQAEAEKAAEEEEAKRLKQKMWEQFVIFGQDRIAQGEFADSVWADQGPDLEGGRPETVESTNQLRAPFDQLRAPFDAWFDVYVMRMIDFCRVRNPDIGYSWQPCGMRIGMFPIPSCFVFYCSAEPWVYVASVRA